jgi:hypothetical protein
MQFHTYSLFDFATILSPDVAVRATCKVWSVFVGSNYLNTPFKKKVYTLAKYGSRWQ